MYTIWYSSLTVKLLEVQYTYEAEHSINQKNCLALKEIADLLSKLVISFRNFFIST